ncbi:hypothetical protein SAMN05216207_1004215 [Pseudonocardia ammonioxydans]|uniref:Uncharacterized protein n=1 Tax=Pseudonocardia ammonioxydans TaxID=260086 RepID=A0A1I4UQC1_PSUAM|nr:hypothetical protein [Pseudonocardia ammonioxydans]SFM90940.1 hypothetical protein SAMN05216207_1004215 [Pseudonocardia ammonioxydans]
MDIDFEHPCERGASYSLSEHKRVLGAVSRARGDWHQAFYEVRDRKGNGVPDMSWSTFCEYAGTRTDTYEVRDDDATTPDIAEMVCAALSPADDDPDTRYRTERVQEAIHALPRRQFEAVVRWSVLARRGVKVRTVRGAKRADTLEDEMTETEARNFRRACESLREALADLATGVHVLRAPRELVPDPQDPYVSGAPEAPVSTRQGDPVHERPSTLPPRFWEEQRFWSMVHEWDRKWVDSVPPVPRNWASLPAGTPWRLESEYQNYRPRKRTAPWIASIQSEDSQ